MTYYEEAIVKKYHRKNNKDSTQINLGVNSKFKKNSKVAVVPKDEFDELDKDLNEVREAIKKGFLQDLEKNSETIVSKDELAELHKIKSEYDKVLDENSKLKDKIIQLQDDHHSELGVEKDKVEKLLILNNSKDNQINTLTHNWKWYKRIFNILPEDVTLNDTHDE